MSSQPSDIRQAVHDHHDQGHDLDHLANQYLVYSCLGMSHRTTPSQCRKVISKITSEPVPVRRTTSVLSPKWSPVSQDIPGARGPGRDYNSFKALAAPPSDCLTPGGTEPPRRSATRGWTIGSLPLPLLCGQNHPSATTLG